MELHQALSQIAAIREQIARVERFRGYRSASTAATAGVAVLTALVQQVAFPTESLRYMFFCYPWFVAAVVSITIVGWGIVHRYRRSDDPVQRELTITAVGQFAPYLVMGLLLTVVLVDVVGYSVWVLPGLWMMLTGLGIHASRAVLPPAVTIVSMYYLMAGLVTLACGRDAAFLPWTMGGVFGFGQLLAAAVLWQSERPGAKGGSDAF